MPNRIAPTVEDGKKQNGRVKRFLPLIGILAITTALASAGVITGTIVSSVTQDGFEDTNNKTVFQNTTQPTTGEETTNIQDKASLEVRSTLSETTMSEIDYQTTADQVTITAPPPPCDKVEVDENSRVDVMVAIPTMVAVSACIWMKTDEVSGGTAISYNIQGGDNEFLLDVPQSLTLSVRGLISGPTGVSVNDGIWHHVCVVWNSVDGMWRMYDNGVAVADGINFRTGLTIRSGGVMILGQEQDTVGGGFNPAQAWKGELAYFNMWDRVLDDAEILHSAQDCYCQIEGNVFSWKSDSLDVTGSATLSPADICSVTSK